MLLVMITVPGCASSNTTGSSHDYPIVEPSRPRMQQPIRTPNGAVVTLPALPTINEADPSPSCERQHATYHDGSQPARRLIVVPPAPGLRAVAVTDHTTRLEWSFLDLPADCRPVTVLLSVRNGTDPGATPTTKQIDVRGLSGSTEITYPDFLPSPDVAAASAYSKQPHRSRTVSVLIERPANLPPNPPEAAPPVTAPAGPPITCNGPATDVDDPIGDILSYAPGSPPTQVKQLSPELSGIDITRGSRPDQRAHHLRDLRFRALSCAPRLPAHTHAEGHKQLVLLRVAEVPPNRRTTRGRLPLHQRARRLRAPTGRQCGRGATRQDPCHHGHRPPAKRVAVRVASNPFFGPHGLERHNRVFPEEVRSLLRRLAAALSSGPPRDDPPAGRRDGSTRPDALESRVARMLATSPRRSRRTPVAVYQRAVATERATFPASKAT